MFELTDGYGNRCQRSTAPVVMRAGDDDVLPGGLPGKLLGVHSARLDIGNRDIQLDEALGLNCAWYANVLMTLTKAGNLRGG